MIKTKLVIGLPNDIKLKRKLRIVEAIKFKRGTKENPVHNVICQINGKDVYFDKPGKEFFRNSDSQNIHDMTPGVGDDYIKYSFSDIWKLLLNLSIHLSDDSYKKLFVIIYRLAYLMDCPIIDDKVRYQPDEDIMNEINAIQKEIDKSKENINIFEFLNFLDVLGWNEDVKYQADLDFDTQKKGRINNLLTMISVPLIFKDFVDEVMDNKDNLKDIDYSSLIDMAQDFSRSRGISPLSNKKLLKYLGPYLVKEDDVEE